jgi:hypothetical protein
MERGKAVGDGGEDEFRVRVGGADGSEKDLPVRWVGLAPVGSGGIRGSTLAFMATSEKGSGLS